MSTSLDLTEKVAVQYAQIRNICYPDKTPVSAYRGVDTIEKRSTIRAETDGFKLTRINPDKFDDADRETWVVTYIHEASHAECMSTKRGKSGHAPAFWEAFARNVNTVLDSQKNRSLVQSVFEEDIDWNRVKYRAVQDVSQVDKRSETVDERRAKLSEDIGYEGYDQFENGEWGIATGKDDSIHGSVGQVNLFVSPTRYADDFSDQELLDFIDKHDGVAPSALVWAYPEEWSHDGPIIIRDEDRFDIVSEGYYDSRKALAVQERLGYGRTALSLGHLLESKSPGEYSDSLPIPFSDVKRLQRPEPCNIHTYGSSGEGDEDLEESLSC